MGHFDQFDLKFMIIFLLILDILIAKYQHRWKNPLNIFN